MTIESGELTPDVVECVACGEPIYRCLAVGRAFSGDRLRPEDFVPFRDSIPQPKAEDPLKCPLCDEPYFVPQGKAGVVLKLACGAWWPHPPVDQPK